MSRWAGVIIAALLIAFTGVALWWHFGRESPKETALNQDTVVEIAEVKARQFVTPYYGTATVVADEAVKVTASVREQVQSVHFADGEPIGKGDTLVTLEQAQEKAVLDQAQARLEEVEREIARFDSLVDQEFVSEQRLDRLNTDKQEAEAQLAQARANLDDRTISAPIGGKVGVREISVGDLVRPGTVITTLDVLQPVHVDAVFPAKALPYFRTGNTMTLTTDIYPDQTFIAPIIHVLPRMDAASQQVAVRAEYANEEKKLKPGLFMRARYDSQPRRNAAVPERALLTEQEKHYVFRYQEGLAKRQAVTIGRRVDGVVEITSGIETGARIITDGAAKLSDGDAVRVGNQEARS